MSERINEGEIAYFREKIAALKPISVDEVDREELELHHEMVTQGFIDLSIVDKYVGKIPDQRRYEETMNWFIQLTEGFLDIETSFASYGLYMPDYIAALQAYQASGGNTYKHKALLVGAHTPNTVNEFAFAIRYVFPDGIPMITDPQGIRTVEASRDKTKFVFGNAVQLPFGGECLDTIHTNNLLPHIKSAGFKEEAHIKFFSEAIRALKPGGLLVMAEWDTNLRGTKFTGAVRKDLKKAGFVDIKTASQANRVTRRHFVKRFMDGEELPQNAYVKDKVVSFFRASKPL